MEHRCERTWWSTLSREWQEAIALNLDLQRRGYGWDGVQGALDRDKPPCAMRADICFVYEHVTGEAYRHDEWFVPHEDDLNTAGYLYLTGLKIDGLEPVSRFHNLVHINCSECQAIASLEPLRGLERLETVILDSCELVDSLDALENATGMQRLECDSTNIDSLAVVAWFPDLQILCCYGCERIDSIEPVSGLKKLQTLDLGECYGIRSLEPLRGLPALRKLSISGCASVPNIQPLENLVSLEFLRVGTSSMHSDKPPLLLKHIRSLTNLRELTWYGDNDLESLDGLEGLVRLEDLSVSLCPNLRDISAVHSLKALRNVLFGCCEKMESFESLNSLPNLASFATCEQEALMPFTWFENKAGMEYVWGCYATSQEIGRVLPKLTRLKEFSCEVLPIEWSDEPWHADSLEMLSVKGMKSLEPVRGLSLLKELHLDFGNEITTLAPLEELLNIDKLDIPGLKYVTSLEPLRNMKLLRDLLMYMCPLVKTLEQLRNLHNLEALDCADCSGLTSLDGLEMMNRLRYISIMDCDKIRSLFPVSGHENIEHLLISGCTQLDALPAFENARQMKRIDCTGCPNIPRHDIERFAEVHPECVVRSDYTQE